MKRKPGRPQADLESRIRIFEKAIIDGKGIYKSLEIADIPTSTYYDYLEKNPEYSDRIEKMQDQLIALAETSIANELKNPDPKRRDQVIELAKWIMRKRKPKVYGDNGPLPQLMGGMNVNLGTQNLIRADDLTDDQLQRMAHGEQLQNVLEGKVIASSPKQ
jgi:hypothetical protein